MRLDLLTLNTLRYLDRPRGILNCAPYGLRNPRDALSETNGRFARWLFWTDVVSEI